MREPGTNLHAVRRPTALVLAALLVGLLLLPAARASAGVLTCPVAEITDVWIYGYGQLVLTTRWQEGATTVVRSWTVCSLEQTVGGVATVPSVCNDVYALAMTAKTTGTTMQIGFLDTVPKEGGGGSATACRDIWQFSQSVADHFYYIRLKNN